MRREAKKDPRVVAQEAKHEQELQDIKNTAGNDNDEENREETKDRYGRRRNPAFHRFIVISQRIKEASGRAEWWQCATTPRGRSADYFG